jgi:hypothetical protein
LAEEQVLCARFADRGESHVLKGGEAGLVSLMRIKVLAGDAPYSDR